MESHPHRIKIKTATKKTLYQDPDILFDMKLLKVVLIFLAILPEIRNKNARRRIIIASAQRCLEKPKIQAFFGSGETRSVNTPEKINSRNAIIDNMKFNCIFFLF
ncbi:MAG: hypothetical protein ABIJ65_11400 [Chloroflexota bacterium]